MSCAGWCDKGSEPARHKPRIQAYQPLQTYTGVRGAGRLTGHSPSLMKEHLNLAEKQFLTREQLAIYLRQRGVNLDEVASG